MSQPVWNEFALQQEGYKSRRPVATREPVRSHKAGAPGVTVEPGAAISEPDPQGITSCMYCGQVNDGASQMFVCTMCGISVCGNSPTGCAQPPDDIPLDPAHFLCPMCCRATRTPITYGLDTLAAEYRVYHEALRPLCLITAHEPELRYFNTILQALFEQEYALAPRMLYSVDLPFSSQGWAGHNTNMGRAQLWQAGNQLQDMPIIVTIDCHSDPRNGQITWRRSRNGIGMVHTVPRVIAEILGGWFKTLPTRAGERGLILMTCGYVVTDAASENQLWALVDTKHFTFIIAFPTTTLIPQRAVLPITRLLQSMMVRGKLLMHALQDTCFKDTELMVTTGIHVTQLTPAKTIRQTVFMGTTSARPWGVPLRCPNAACTGPVNDIFYCTHHTLRIVRIRCKACQMQTKDYVQVPDWLCFADRENHIVEYPLVVDGKPVACALLEKCAMIPWPCTTDSQA